MIDLKDVIDESSGGFTPVNQEEFLMISNAFDTVRLWSDFSNAEVNLLTVTMLEIAKRTGSVYEPISHDMELSLNLKELAFKSGISKFEHSNSTTVAALEKIHRTLATANVTFYEDATIKSRSFFTGIDTNRETGDLTVYLNARMVNDYLKLEKCEGFTLLDVYRFLELKNKYTKGMFYVLSHWASKGFVNLSIDDWKRSLYVPKSCTNAELFSKYIMPALEELQEKGWFSISKVDKVKRKGSKAFTSCKIVYQKSKPIAVANAAEEAIQEPTPVVVQPTAPETAQKAPDSTPYALDMFGMPITKAEYDELESYLQEQCELLEGA